MPEQRVPGPFSNEALQTIAELLQAADQYGLGVVFQPELDGWRISYVIDWPAYEEYELPAGELSNTYDLHLGASAALKPLIELGERYKSYLESRQS